MSSKWHGHASRSARAYWRPLLPQPCVRCGLPVIHNPNLAHGGWQPDHWPVPRELGGTETRPAHSHCNMSAGGKRGAEITNAKRRARARRPAVNEIANNIRGI